MSTTPVLFFDLDGTLVNEKKEIPASAVRAIRQAQKNGCLCLLNTGRVYCNVDRSVHELGMDGFVCGCGTTVILKGELLSSQRMEPATCRKIARQLQAFGITPIYEGNDKMFLDMAHAPADMIDFVRWWCRNSGAPIGDVEDEDFRFDKLSVRRTPGAQWEAYQPYIASQGFQIIHIDDVTHEIVPAWVTKGTGLQLVMDTLHLPIENSYAFGDSNNDLPMLAAAGHAIAMGGSTGIYDKVEYVTTTVDDDGIQNALLHYGLI